MAILMAGTATACLGSGNLKPAPRLGLRGGCHCCHYFYKSIRKIIIKVVCEIPGNAGNRPPHSYASRGNENISHSRLGGPS